MTTLAWDGFTLAADKMSCSGNTKHALVTKIRRINECLVGITGSFTEGLALMRWLEGGAIADELPDIESDNNPSMVVITPKKKIMLYEAPFLVPVPFENGFQAFGSGRDFALAVMSHGFDARTAVVTASRFDMYAGNGVDTLTFD